MFIPKISIRPIAVLALFCAPMFTPSAEPAPAAETSAKEFKDTDIQTLHESIAKRFPALRKMLQGLLADDIPNFKLDKVQKSGIVMKSGKIDSDGVLVLELDASVKKEWGMQYKRDLIVEFVEITFQGDMVKGLDFVERASDLNQNMRTVFTHFITNDLTAQDFGGLELREVVQFENKESKPVSYFLKDFDNEVAERRFLLRYQAWAKKLELRMQSLSSKGSVNKSSDIQRILGK